MPFTLRVIQFEWKFKDVKWSKMIENLFGGECIGIQWIALFFWVSVRSLKFPIAKFQFWESRSRVQLVYTTTRYVPYILYDMRTAHCVQFFWKQIALRDTHTHTYDWSSFSETFNRWISAATLWIFCHAGLWLFFFFASERPPSKSLYG